VERYRRRCRLAIADEPEDLILAILRLAPDDRAAALADAQDLPGEQGAAIRYALGAGGETIGPTAPLWGSPPRGPDRPGPTTQRSRRGIQGWGPTRDGRQRTTSMGGR